MPKATITLTNGTIVTIDGSLEDVNYLVNIYTPSSSKPQIHKKTAKSKRVKVERPHSNKFDALRITNTIHNCDEAEKIEKNILDKPNELNRVLLPLYILEKYLKDESGLTTSEISKVTVKLGVKVSRQNSLRAVKFTGPKYIFSQSEGNRFPRYQLNRRGMKYMDSVISGTAISDEGGEI